MRKSIIYFIMLVVLAGCQTTATKSGKMEKKVQTVELVLFKTKAGISQSEAENALKSLNECVSQFDGFIGRTTAQAEDGQWLDLVYWENLASAQKASQEIQNSPKAQEAFKVIEMTDMLFKHFDVKWEYGK